MEGSLLDGSETDNTERTQWASPSQFALNNINPGFVARAVELMKPGARMKFVIPPKLAYGEKGNPPVIFGPNSILIYNIELVKVFAKLRKGMKPSEVIAILGEPQSTGTLGNSWHYNDKEFCSNIVCSVFFNDNKELRSWIDVKPQFTSDLED